MIPLPPNVQLFLEAREWQEEGIGPQEDVGARPREFLLKDLDWGEAPLMVRLEGWLCDDAGTRCWAVSYRYEITRKRDPYAGWRPGRLLSRLLRLGDRRNKP